MSKSYPAGYPKAPNPIWFNPAYNPCLAPYKVDWTAASEISKTPLIEFLEFFKNS